MRIRRGLQPPKRPLEELPCLCHVLLDIRLEMPRAGFPIVGCIADAAGQEDEFVGIHRWENPIFGKIGRAHV